eukprot:CAMPEP_0115840770 /NCGR_PEP_ID=MMETSP0287-20121206/6942_1 /TAXON_ID=412157 /ORGANISM="Chrysochromulina rotalis, Strain UIO044" /LENGTH=208 /DNA_ID=CAMNT_0003294391 /DNA_START=121 /DNA_END=747 /DNA_ORIENTATION=-
MEEYRLNNYILPGPVKPVGNQVLVKMRKLEEKTGGGLFVPTADTEKPKEGIVVASGPGRVNAESGELIPNPVSEGDLVLLSDFTGEKVEYNGEKHIFVEADGLLGKFEGGKVTASSFTPIADRVLVAVAEAEKETSTGIALALDDDDDEFAGEVVAVGAGKYLTNGQQKAVDITTGNNVMYKRHTGHNAKMDGKSFKIVFENDCIAKW